MDPRTAIEAQRRLFAILDEFFYRATGESYSNFAPGGDFSESLRTKARSFKHKVPVAFQWLGEQLNDHYKALSMEPFSAAKALGGSKLVSGGRFGARHVASFRKSLLYADTILIPDPILPWFEVERREEKFKLPLIFESIYNLLQLKPLVDAELSVLPILVFPSWEKRLEEQDQQTKEGIGDLFVRVMSHYTGAKFDAPSDVFEFAGTHTAEFLRTVEQQKLFIPPNSKPGLPIDEAIERLREERRTWTGGSYLETFEELSGAHQVVVAIYERMAPLFHHLENSFELDAHPLTSLESQAHYLRLYAKGTSESLEVRGNLGTIGSAAVSGLMQQPLEWLEDIPMADLVRLRTFGDNESFRKKTDEFLKQLSEANLQDIDKVAAEVSRGIASLVSEHQRKMLEIREKYALEHKKTLAMGVAGAMSFCPILAPYFAAITPSAMAIKYGFDKLGEQSELRKASKSLIGVIANARLQA